MKTNDLYNQMLSAYELATEQQRRNAVFEINQQIILAGLYSGGFFNEAAFYGGTCLRIFLLPLHPGIKLGYLVNGC